MGFWDSVTGTFKKITWEDMAISFDSNIDGGSPSSIYTLGQILDGEGV